MLRASARDALPPTLRVLKTFEPVAQGAATADEAGDDEEGEAAGEATGIVGGRAKRPRDHCGAGGGAGDEKDEEEERAEEREAGGDEACSHGQSVLAELTRAQASLALLEARSVAAAAVVLARVDAEAALLPARRRVATQAAMAAATQRYTKRQKRGHTSGRRRQPPFFLSACLVYALRKRSPQLGLSRAPRARPQVRLARGGGHRVAGRPAAEGGRRHGSELRGVPHGPSLRRAANRLLRVLQRGGAPTGRQK